MRNMIAFSLILLLSGSRGFPAGERTPAGGRSLAMGGVSVAVCDFWSLSNNQAGTAFLKVATAGLSFRNQFLLREIMCEQAGIVIPLNAGTFGILLDRYGNRQYNEFKAGVSYARKIGKYFSAAVQIYYLRIQILNDYGHKNLLSCEFGMMFHADKHLTIGVHLCNPVPVRIIGQPPEQLPTIICTGLSYRFSDDFLAGIEIEKDLLHPMVSRCGAEYRFAGRAYARLGISANPMSFTFGFGLEIRKLRLDIASEYNQVLGFSPTASFTYSFK